MIAKNQSAIQKKIDKLFAEFAKAQLSETIMRLKQGRLLKQVAAYCDANNCSFRYNCRRNLIEPKKALALISIWEAYNAKTLTMEKIGEVGCCKLMLIAPKLGAVYKKFGQWKLCHDQWCKPGETSAVATILTSMDAAADERLANLLAERFNEALELKELLTKPPHACQRSGGEGSHAFGCMEIQETPTNDLKKKIEAILGAT